ncbi:MAG: L-aspartate oxidase [Peptococcaceae bacterium]|nr:L-aspartate oxidase [Peptococcaceae bacterium]
MKDSYGSNLEYRFSDVVVVGSGIAGLFAAMGLAEECQVTVLTKAGIERSSTEEAQGGIAAALRPDDSPASHFQDTLLAGADLCNEEAVHVLTQKGPEYVRKLMGMGVEFDRVRGELDFTREAAHSNRRILHAGGDMTGQVIQRQLAANARRDGLRVEENCFVVDLLKDEDGAVVGVLALRDGVLTVWMAKAVILATGGLGQLYQYTSNPEVLTGDGMAAALRAGAELMNMEFVQFHPTVFLQPDGKCFLISEAARGEGARLINERGEFFMDAVPGKEMAPRDVVARAIWAELARGPVYLDFSTIVGKDVREGFPQIYRNCLQGGVDITQRPVPVMPAAHYSMGGVRIDIEGRTNLKNLFACGECACNGVHGANRLASNSLLDGLVFGSEVRSGVLKAMLGAGEIGVCEAQDRNGGGPQGVPQLVLDIRHSVFWERLLEFEEQLLAYGIRFSDAGNHTANESGIERSPRDVTAEHRSPYTEHRKSDTGFASSAESGTSELRAELTAIMWDKVGIIRHETGLKEVLARLDDLAVGVPPVLHVDSLELANLLVLGKVIALSALGRQESRGGHYREDYPVSSSEFHKNSVCTRGRDGHDSVEFVNL